VCDSGYSGTLSATCDNGVFSTSGTCVSTSCTTAPAILNADVGTCKLPAPTGTFCLPTCNTGYTGDLTATCTSGTWQTSSACALPVYCSQPSAPTTYSLGSCGNLPHVPSGYSCNLTCSEDGSQHPITCDGSGNWTAPVGSCRSQAASDDPPVGLIVGIVVGVTAGVALLLPLLIGIGLVVHVGRRWCKL
jgi:hypothetical protein